MKKAKIISIINYKGGVGKTVSAFNIAAGLNFLNQNKVLLIDLDPQCSMSRACMRAYTNSYQRSGISNLTEVETINHVFRTNLNEDIIDFNYKIDLNKLIKKDFYTGNHLKLKGCDFIPASMYMATTKGYIRGLDELEGDIRCKYSYDSHAQLKQTTILSRFIKEYELETQYDFIIFDCPPSNNIITQNALLVSDYYLVPAVMDDMGSQGVDHVTNIIENTFINSILNEYETMIQLSPDSSYLSLLKKGRPQLLGIFETLKKSGSNTDSAREKLNKKYSNKLFNSIIYNQIDVSRAIDMGECCFTSSNNKRKNATNVSYGSLVFEILDRLGIKKSPNARNITDVL